MAGTDILGTPTEEFHDKRICWVGGDRDTAIALYNCVENRVIAP
jgi:hypothetical protein